MELSTLVQDLKSHTNGSKLSRQEAEELVDGRVICPDDFERGEIEFEDMNFGNKSPTPLYHLSISSFPKRTIDEIQPILDEMLRKSKELQLDKGVADVKYNVFWTPEDFQEETKLPAFFSSEIKVRGRAYSIDPTKVRIGFQGQSHEVEVSMEANKLTLTAKGHYQRELENLIEALNPQVAKLRLSKEDAQRLLRSVKGSPAGKYLAPSLEKALQPKEMMTLSVGLGGIGFGNQEIIEIVLRTKHLDNVRGAIGKPLLNGSGKEETGVTGLIRLYHAVDLLRGKRLSDLQYLAGAIPKMDLGIVYGTPVITLGQAKELLEAEINLMTKGYESVSGLGLNSHMWRGGVVKRLAREHFGGEVVDQFEELTVNDYVDFLKAKGYVPPKIAEEVPNLDKARELASLSLKERMTPEEYLRRLKVKLDLVILSHISQIT